ncbi:decaprenyl-phosphate phosphoribosyltransferase [Nocardiopsis sp. MG754419]|uniref:decaprenyl-phosphate phosphoribosyltransferase n=1 Tax=Nocardiopsis sp. MG754419 TaxID=2259865 RepID=UPI001BA7DFD1|nr:decaprenyl-phosphate phosphoribosyltransferase [Nocardiopsis sp. MG754419]MBR8743643.1 decaprenyl-phosphate phosphoribosyltransferase [Nocardiopsis sp. MG754419]
MTTTPETENPPGRSDVVGTPLALLRACRPRQWLKNLLVFAAPAAAGALTDPAALLTCLATFVLFGVAAGGTYLLNDVRDAPRDRRHPRKRHRPVASGALSVPVAVVVGVLFVTAAPPASLALGVPALSAVIGAYVLLTLAYTRYLKDRVVVDLVAVAACHVLRAMAGAYAVGVPLTSWFVIVVSLAALLVVVGKREAELRTATDSGPEGDTPVETEDPATPTGHGGPRDPGPARTDGVSAVDGAHPTRVALLGYTPGYLAQIRTIASGAMIVTYCLWALEQADGPQSPFHAASIVPFIMFVLRYNLLVDRGAGEEPEEIALRDRPLQCVLVALVLLVGLGIYL